MREEMEAILRSLYQDIFDTGNCPAVDSHYRDDAICHFNNLELTLQDLKASMAKFVSLHSDIKTEIEDLLIDGNKTFARLKRTAICNQTKQKKIINIMVVKKFVEKKVAELWFMVDDHTYQEIWSEPKTQEFQCMLD